MADFEIAGVSYQSRLMDGETQMLVMRRMLPTFTALIGLKDSIGDTVVTDDSGAKQFDMAALSTLVAPVSRELAALSDADTKFVLDACMDVTTRRLATGPGWAAVRQKSIIQDPDDAKFVTRLRIAWNVLIDNFRDMFASMGVDLNLLMGMRAAFG